MNKEKALKNQGLEFREDIMYKGGNLCSKDCNSNQKSIQKSQCIGYILMIFG